MASGCAIALGYVPCGFAWSFPKADRLSVGLAGLGLDGRGLKEGFARFLKDAGLPENARSGTVKGGVVPFGTWLAVPGTGNALLTGDAAGYAEPVSGEGIYYALLSGTLAARAVLKGNAGALASYTAEVRGKIIPELKEALRVRPLLFNRALQPVGIRLFASKPERFAAFIQAVNGSTTYVSAFRKALFN